MTHNNDELRCQIQCHVGQQDAMICAPHRIADLNVCVLLAHWEVTDDHAQVIYFDKKLTFNWASKFYHMFQ